MFRKLSIFRKKDGDEGRLLRFHRTARTLELHSSDSSPSLIPSTVQEVQVEPISDSHLSKSAAAVRSAQPRQGSETEAGPLGLTVVYAPENGYKADIVFIHGLGGTSRWTWSKNKDPELFWPLKFLPLEPDVCLARISTFGYNANFRRAGSVSTTVLDFAKELLFDLKYAKDEGKEDLGMGSVPLIFVAHSMGGLIVKEAYIQGQNDPEYESIIKAISAIIFLSTPHRGTHLAETLNRILQSTMISNSKLYISELAKNSITLQRLNEQFRHIAPRLDIVSFYETQPTSILLNARVMVLEKDSSVLGYPGETSKALDADHHGVCKYTSPNDPNYITVRNVIISLLRKIASSSTSKETTPLNRSESHDLKSLLAITEHPAIDYSFFRDQWAPGTCEWILQNEDFIQWFQAPESMSTLLFLNGKAASGKSVLSSFLINNLVEKGACCQYFYIRFGDQKKRTLGAILRAIVYQMAQMIPKFLAKLLELPDETIDYETADPRTIWDRIFRSILFKMVDTGPLYWIIDGLDEAHDPREIFKLLPDISSSSVPLRILLVGRRTPEIESALQKVPNTLSSKMIGVEGHTEDLDSYVRQEITMPGDSDFKESVVKRVVEGSQNNFLWVRLAVDKLNLCYRLADVELALQELPDGMEALYDRMASSIAQNPSPTNRELASSILQFITSSFSGLTIAGLSQALNEDMSELLDLKRSVVDLCGGFATVDNGGNVTLIHHTAREYLLRGNKQPFHIGPDHAHESMFLSCMKCLMTIGLRSQINRNQVSEFVDYASSWWSSHLVLASLSDDKVDEVLRKFLTSHWVLTWIHILAASKKQRILIETSRNLSKYCFRRRQLTATPKAKGQQLFESWSTDFVKVMGKFGASLQQNPESIYKLIPPFCPLNSSIYQLFGKAEAKHIAVLGVSTESWDGSLARISLGSGRYASSITVSGAIVAVLAPPGSVFIYDSSTFEEATISPIEHGERLYRMELNKTGTLLATYGYRTTRIWDIPTGNCTTSVDNPMSRPRPLTMLFEHNSTTLLVGAEDLRIRSLNMNQQSPTWQLVTELGEPELEGHFAHSSSYMAFNKDGTLVAVAYRSYPLSAWELQGPVHIGHCWRKREETDRGDVIDAVWHPHSPELLGLYTEGVLFKWRPYDDDIVEVAIGASRLAISGDGNLIATGDVRGTVRIFATSNLVLLHQLTAEDTVLGLAFSPDPKRIFDIRRDHGNVWEPNVLLKLTAEQISQDESRSETGDLSRGLLAYSNSSRRIDSVTVFSASPAGHLYSYGTVRGVVRLLDLREEKSVDVHVSRGFLSIEQMSWSSDGRYFCFSDSAKRVFIMKVIDRAETPELAVETVAEISMNGMRNGPITQFLFHPKSSHLLISFDNFIRSVSLASSLVEYSVESEAFRYHRWIAHPQDPELVIGFGPDGIQILDWNLVEIRSVTPSLLRDLDCLSVDKVLVTQDRRHVLVQISSRNHSKEQTLQYFKTSDFPTSSGDTPETGEQRDQEVISPVILPYEVSSEVAFPLSFLSHNRLIFLSRDHSVCSWQLTDSKAMPTPRVGSSIATMNPSCPTNRHKSSVVIRKPFKELFWLPGDWISKDSLSLCSIWEVEKCFLCPRNGEVAVVKCAALA
ncbi:hypothetical protein F4818DRAFT_423988 [Hypoxylon cercidicola]|nr:hypothetical protein F4818DRAFT_423988 [Hypoxylon cercidicola]